MLEWIANNLSTIVISLILIAVVALIVIKTAVDKRNGKSSCSCGCQNCAMRDSCHKK
ncbi:MAG: FeoB-associated Cys-rich membrane protein [Clostridiales bacterium]|nr:FeoB-associated Cys-rich membrane protein [Clostridiales bacterium]